MSASCSARRSAWSPIIVFDHHANHRFGAARPEDYPAALAKFHGCFLDRAYQLAGAGDQSPFLVGNINVDEYLRVPGHHISDVWPASFRFWPRWPAGAG